MLYYLRPRSSRRGPRHAGPRARGRPRQAAGPPPVGRNVYIYIYIYIHICLHIEREREIHYVYIYIYIYICIQNLPAPDRRPPPRVGFCQRCWVSWPYGNCAPDFQISRQLFQISRKLVQKTFPESWA